MRSAEEEYEDKDKGNAEERKAKIAADFRRNVSAFLSTTTQGREEMYRALQYRDGHQVDQETWKRRTSKDKSITQINLSSPLVRAVSGTECMTDKGIDVYAIDPEFDQQADIMADAVAYVRYKSGADAERSRAKEDAAGLGVGATVTWLDMSSKERIYGDPVTERIFPGFVFFDTSCRDGNVNRRMRWCGYAEAVSTDYLAEYIKEKDIEANAYMGGDFKAELLSFSRQQDLHLVDFIYHYMWWEDEEIYDLANPYVSGGDKSLIAAIMEDDDAANVMGEAAQRHQIDWEAQYWSLNKEAFDDLKLTMEVIGDLLEIRALKLNYATRKGKCYYKAEIAGGQVLDYSRTYTQDGFPLNIVTGYYDETLGYFYGLFRSLSWVQDALNNTVSDFLDYTRSAANGGSVYIQGAADKIERVIKEKAHENAVTPLPEGAVVTPKSLPTTPQAMVEFIRLLIELMPRCIGLTEQFMGVVTSGDMTDSLFGSVMRQSHAVLANLANSAAHSDRRQIEIEMAIVRLMAEANDGDILPILSPGKEGDQYFRLLKQNLARSYAIRSVERPMTDDEKQDAFNKLSALAPQYAQAGVNILPIISKLAPLNADERNQLVQLSTPQPPQPDPRSEALMDAQVRLTVAQAAKLEQDAIETQNAATLSGQERESIIQKNLAQAEKSLADAGVSQLKGMI